MDGSRAEVKSTVRQSDSPGGAQGDAVTNYLKPSAGVRSCRSEVAPVVCIAGEQANALSVPLDDLGDPLFPGPKPWYPDRDAGVERRFTHTAKISRKCRAAPSVQPRGQRRSPHRKAALAQDHCNVRRARRSGFQPKHPKA
jgi:hypothetical protein